MILAKNNIIVQLNNSVNPQYAIMNPITGSFDLLDAKEYRQLQAMNSQRGMKGGADADVESATRIQESMSGIEAPTDEFIHALLERGYAYESEKAQEAAVEKAYKAFKKEVDNGQVQLMLVPTYGCNLACTYCFQHGIDGRPTLITKEIVDAFFKYAGDKFSELPQKPFITLFGGEPLVNSPAQRAIMNYIVDCCAKEGYELSAVTNGYDFLDYVEMLKKVKVKEIQFTLDGSKEIHDVRRWTANKKGTFDRVIAGMEAAVENGIPINLRSVVDLENIEDIVHLAEYLDQKGWLDLPPELFKTQIGRNYELFECYAKPQHLMSQVELWARFASLSKEYPVLAKLHRPDFKGIRHLVDTGEMYMASFDTCPACKTEWVFDLHGEIYGCTASCGRPEYLLGTYWPQVQLNEKAIDTWRRRDAKSISECRDCRFDVICGGGCGVVAANAHQGRILSPDCRPVGELMELGINHYADQLIAMADEDEQGDDVGKSAKDSLKKGRSAKVKVKVKAVTPLKTQGCLICGEELVYSRETTLREACQICGDTFQTNVKCPKGHFVCDKCHSQDISGKVERMLLGSKEKDPSALAQKIFELPGLNMHGPEYHSIVPGVLVAAWGNLTGKGTPSMIREALRRGADVKGGNCGYFGNCGAGVGAGIAVSVIEGATPLSSDGRGAANRATGQALLEIGKHDGPRCCKREAITSIETFMKTTEYFNGIKPASYHCWQYGNNKTCILARCPYFPK